VLLIDIGSLGIVTLEENAESVVLGAYFSAEGEPSQLAIKIEESFSHAGLRHDLLNVDVKAIPDQDWLRKWREGYEPGTVGDRFVIAPSWKVPTLLEDGRIVLRIDPGMAFGTGTHETTRLCLELIEKYWWGGCLLDVGTGTGILAIAAALLTPESRVVAIDIDPQAVEVALENIEINGVENITTRAGQPADLRGEYFDLLVANLTAEVIVSLTGDMVRRLKPDAALIASGILKELISEVEKSFHTAGLQVVERREAGEWAAIVARRT
jgi:ribosomal protein L11 methyltransferase